MGSKDPPEYVQEYTAGLSTLKRSSARADSTRDPIALADEIFELKKAVLAYRSERDFLAGKVRSLEQQASAGVPQHGSRPGTAGTLGGSKMNPESDSRLVSGLKHQIRDLSSQLKAKDNDLIAVRNTLKMCRLDELEAEVGVYYAEVQRLQQILVDQAIGAQHGGGQEDFPDPTGRYKGENGDLAKVKAENTMLKTDLDAALNAAYRLKATIGLNPTTSPCRREMCLHPQNPATRGSTSTRRTAA